MKPSPSRSPYCSIHSIARSALGSNFRKDVVVEPPSTELAEQHHEQRRGIDRAVVGAVSGQRRSVDAEVSGLVHDPSGLLLGDRIDVATLQFGERLEHTERQCRIDRQRHVRADQRITTEQRHVPRRAGGDHRSAAARGSCRRSAPMSSIERSNAALS